MEGNNNNANAQQPTAQQPAPVQPKEPSWCEEAWETTKAVAGISTTAFCIEFARAAGITLGACLVLKAFGVFDRTSDNV